MSLLHAAAAIATPRRFGIHQPQAAELLIGGREGGLGSNPKTIASGNLDGVALAAIQGLNAKLETTVAEQARENARLRSELADLRSLREEMASIRVALSRDHVANR